MTAQDRPFVSLTGDYCPKGKCLRKPDHEGPCWPLVPTEEGVS